MSSRRYIAFPRVEGVASRQAHADLPPGTYEREIGKEGFFGPSAHLYHRHPPTAWVSFEGPLRPRAFDLARLDRTEPKWGSRLMFFRCGDMIVEVVHNLNEPASDTPDALWGLSWRTPDIDATHARLASQGFTVSEIRTGRKPGTRVFTVKDGTLGVPTLVLQPPARDDN